MFIETNTEELKSTCTISNVCKEDVGFYICKAVNSVSEISTRAKLDLASSASAASTKKTTTEIKSLVKESATTVEESATTVTDTVSTIKETSKVKSEKKVKSHKKLSQTQKSVKEENQMNVVTVQQTQKDVKKDIEMVESELTIIEPAHLEIIRGTGHDSVNQSKIEITTKQEEFEEVEEDQEVEIVEETEEIHVKIYKEVFSVEEMENLKITDEVNAILDSIDAGQFGSGERPLRELATIGHLLKKGIEISEIIQLYDENFFTALKLPESQSALVQLVERQGYENLITEILNATSSTDEKLLASTVGFRAFMRLIEVTKTPVEEIIKNFKFEDFVSQEWKHKEIKENEYVEVTGSHTSSIRAEKITVIGNEFE